MRSTGQNECRQPWDTPHPGVREKVVGGVKEKAGQMLTECNYFNGSVFSKFRIAHMEIVTLKKTHIRNFDLEHKKLSLSPATQGGARFTTTLVTADHGGRETDRHVNPERQKKAKAGHSCFRRQQIFPCQPCCAGRWLGSRLGIQTHHTRGSASHWSYTSACPGAVSAGHHLLCPKGVNSQSDTGCSRSRGCVGVPCMVLAVMPQGKCEPH